MAPVDRGRPTPRRRGGWALGLVALSLVTLAALGVAGRWGADDPGPLDRRTAAHRIAVNTADAAELQLLPGVGESLAAAIIASRDAHGPFAGLDDLRRVNGIGPQLPLRWQPHITFETDQARDDPA